jgi:predicted Zn-dependent protease
MTRRTALAIIVTLGIAALVWSERHPANVRVTPASLLYFIADSEWELTRLPMRATRLSDQEEIDIGNRMAAQFYMDRVNSGLTPGDKQQVQVVRDYVNRVGGKVAARAHRKLPYRFHYIPSTDFVNAFALPGGHVYIGAGLMELMDSEDELAAVLGHEVEHIDHYHCAERVQTEARLRRLPLGELAAIPIMVFEAGYSKDQELEADREGTQLAVWAGYSPQGAVRMFETFDRLYQEYVRRAQSPQEELSRVAIQTLEGYFRSHPLPSERVDQVRKLINANNWSSLDHERNLEVAYIFWTGRAQRAYAAGHYKEAAGWAKRSLEVKPDQPIALLALGNAQFAQANFSEAVVAFGQALEKTPYGDALVATYADALAARHTPAQSLQDFEALLAKRPELKPRLAPAVELAGLTLAARGEAAAQAVVAPLKAGAGADLPPEFRGRLGWWYYRVGNFDRAAELLTGAVRERPADAVMAIQLGWALVEQHNLEGAIERFNLASNRYSYPESGGVGQFSRRFNERRVGLAVAEWQAQQSGRAVGEFAAASLAQPEWLNPQWVSALYSPGVAKTIEELKAEQKKPLGLRSRVNY